MMKRVSLKFHVCFTSEVPPVCASLTPGKGFKLFSFRIFVVSGSGGIPGPLYF